MPYNQKDGVTHPPFDKVLANGRFDSELHHASILSSCKMLRDAGPPSLIVPNLFSLPSSNEQALLRDAATSAAIDGIPDCSIARLEMCGRERLGQLGLKSVAKDHAHSLSMHC